MYAAGKILWLKCGVICCGYAGGYSDGGDSGGIGGGSGVSCCCPIFSLLVFTGKISVFST